MSIHLNRKKILALAICSVGAAVLFSTPASGALISYIGATDTNWYEGANWLGGVFPANNLNQDTVVFDQASYANQPYAAGVSISGIVVGDGSTATAPLTISGTSLGIGAGGISILANSGSVTLMAPVQVGLGQTWTNASANAFAIAGALTRSAGDDLNLVDSGTGSITTTSLSNDATGIIGPWVSYTSGGATQYATVTGGVVTGYTGMAITDANSITSASTNYDLTLAGTSVTTGNTTGNTLRFSGATARQITLGAASTNYTLTLNGLMNAGSGTLTIANGASNTGGVVIGSSQELVLDAAGGNITINTPIFQSASGASSVSLTGSGTVTLGVSATASTFSGGFTINPGVTLNITSGSIGSTLGTGNLTINGGSITNGFTSTATGTLYLNGSFTRTKTLSLTSFANTVLGSSINVTDTADNNILTIANVSDGGNGYGITSTGTGYLSLWINTLQGGSTFTGPITMNGGQLQVAYNISVPTYGPALAFNRSMVINLNMDGASAPSIYLSNATPMIAGLNGVGSVTTNSGGLIIGGSGSYTFAGTLGTVISLTKDGIGTETLTGTNTATSALGVNSGTLVFDFSGAAAPLTNLYYNGVVPAKLSLGGGTLVLSGASGAANSQTVGSIVVNAGDSSIQLLNPGTSLALMSGNVARNTGGTVDFTLSAGTQVQTAVINTNGILGGWATVGGADWATSGATTTVTTVAAAATNGPFTITGGLITGTPIAFNASPGGTGITAGQIYYVINGGGTTYNIAATLGGTAVLNTNASPVNNAAAVVDNLGNITALATYSPFVSTGGTSTANYVLTSSNTVTANETFYSLKVAPSAASQTLTLGSLAAAATLTANNLLFTGANGYTIASGGNAATQLRSGGELIVEQYNTGDVTINATINASSLTKSGPGRLILTTSNLTSGVDYLNQGIVNINALTALGTGVAANTLAFNGGTLQYATGFTGSTDISARAGIVPVSFGAAGGAIDTNNNAVTFADPFGNGGLGGLTKNGAGTLTLNGVGAYNGATTINGGVLSIGTVNAVNSTTLSGTTGNAGTNTTLTVSSTAGLVPGQTISGTGIASGTTIASILSATTLTMDVGPTTANLNTSLTFGAINNTGIGIGSTPSSIGNSTYAADNLVFNGGTLQYTGSGATTDRLFTVNAGGATIDASGSGALNFTNPSSLVFNGGNLVLTGTGNGSMTPIISSSATLTKSGGGTWTLNGDNSYSGVTTITGGTLKLSAANNNIAGSSKIIVGDSLADNSAMLDVSGVTNGFVLGGSQTLAGHGTVVGNVTTSSGSILAPGNSIGTTSYSAGLTLAAGTVLNYEFAGSSSSDDSQVAGLLTLPTGTGSITLNMTDAGGLTAGTFKIFGYGTLAGGAPSSLNDTFVINPPGSPSLAGDTYSVVDNMGSNEIDLVISGSPVPEPASLALLGLGAAGLLMRRRRRA